MEAAKLAREAGVPHFSLLTAQYANPNIWASNFIAMHPLLYMRTKGQAEEAVKQLVRDLAHCYSKHSRDQTVISIA